jgi:hypothetical protein
MRFFSVDVVHSSTNRIEGSDAQRADRNSSITAFFGSVWRGAALSVANYSAGVV